MINYIIDLSNIDYSNIYNFNLQIINDLDITLTIEFDSHFFNTQLFNILNVESVDLILTNTIIASDILQINISNLSNFNYVVHTSNYGLNTYFNIYIHSELNSYNIFTSNFTLDDLTYNINIYHPIYYDYNYYDYSIFHITSVNYNINANIISQLSLENININTIDNLNYSIDFINSEITTIIKTYTTTIYKQIEIDNNIIYLQKNININLNDINNTIDSNIFIDIIIKEQKTHIKLTNKNINDSIEHSYYINNFQNNFEICYSDNNIYKKTLSLDNNGLLIINKLQVNDIIIKGQIYDNQKQILENPDFYELKVKNNNLYIKTEEHFKILFNINNTEHGDNVIIGNNSNIGIDNILTLYNESGSNTYINFINSYDTQFTIGQTKNNFIIFYNNIDVFTIIKKTNYYTLIDPPPVGYDTLLDVNDGYIHDYIYNQGCINGINRIKINEYIPFIFTLDDDFTSSTKLLLSINRDNVTMYVPLMCNAGTSTISDIRVKQNIIKITNSLEIIDKLTGVFYDSKISKCKEVGLIAQDVIKFLPEVVSKNKDDLLGIQYGNIVGLLIEGIKDLKKDITDIKQYLNI